MSSFVVLLDACAIFPASLRDTLLRAADAGLYRLQLTDQILEEMRRNLVSEVALDKNKAQRLAAKVKEYFPEAFVTHYELLIPSMPTNEKDRHVLAAAITCNAQVIVTQNLKDFPAELISPFGVEAQSPDEFLINLYYLSPQVMISIITDQANDLRNPPMTVLQLLNILTLHTPTFVQLILSALG